jgi:hypothetical protein
MIVDSQFTVADCRTSVISCQSSVKAFTEN